MLALELQVSPSLSVMQLIKEISNSDEKTWVSREGQKPLHQTNHCAISIITGRCLTKTQPERTLITHNSVRLYYYSLK